MTSLVNSVTTTAATMTTNLTNTNTAVDATPNKCSSSKKKKRSRTRRRWYEPVWRSTLKQQQNIELSTLPRLEEVHVSQLDELIHLKLLGCCEIFSFHDKNQYHLLNPLPSTAENNITKPTSTSTTATATATATAATTTSNNSNNHTNAMKELKHKRSAKRNTLIELVEFVSNSDENRLRFFSPSPVIDYIPDETTKLCAGGHLKSFVMMVQSNLFCPHFTHYDGERGGTLVTRRRNFLDEQSMLNDSEESIDEAVLTNSKHRSSSNSVSSRRGISSSSNVHNAAWSHVQVVYEFVVRFVFDDLITAEKCRGQIGRTFLSGLLEQFKSSDVRECGYVKTIIHQCYTKFMSLRTFIRGTMMYMLSEYVEGSVTYYDGLVSMLEILASIIAGFKSPLRSEHITMLKHVLMPLHKCTLDNNGFESLDAFEALHPPLLECITSFIERDPPTLKIVVQGLSSAWSHRPHSLLLEELEVVINLSPPNIFRSIASNVLQLLSVAVSDQHFQIAERALLLWRGEYFVSLIAQHRHTALPLLYQPLVQSETKHWHPQVRVLASNVLKLFQSMDEHLFRQQEEELE